MPRQARVVVPGEPHHVVQRGNRRQRTFFGERDYRVYLKIAAETFHDHGVEAWAYCLMPNHVHLVLAPSSPESLAKAVGAVHQRYTHWINQREGWTGYLWQGRFGSFPMDEGYLLRCARYVGLNPVRAGLVPQALDWPWSSVRAHVRGSYDPLLTREPLISRLGAALPEIFQNDLEEEELKEMRAAASTGRPLGGEAWVQSLEAAMGRKLAPRPIGRPRKAQKVGTHTTFWPGNRP